MCIPNSACVIAVQDSSDRMSFGYRLKAGDGDFNALLRGGSPIHQHSDMKQSCLNRPCQKHLDTAIAPMFSAFDPSAPSRESSSEGVASLKRA